MDDPCQNCGARGRTGRCRLRFRRRSGAPKTITVELCDTCSDSIGAEEWIRVLSR